ncbi:LytTR family DNA-binding domain-containing protein [Lachnospiraceae bacterium 54-11]
MNTVICCDDNKEFCNLMEILLQKHQAEYDINVVKFYDADELLQFCSNNEFDIIYLDIELGEQNGLKVAKKLKYFNPKSLIIYISAYENYYVDMVQAEPFRFIKKDASNIAKLEKDLTQALSDAIQRVDETTKFTYIFKRNEYTIELNKIRYFHSITRTIHICGTLGDMPTYFYGKMDELQEKLKEKDNSFARISKSYIVNTNYVKSMNKNQVKIEGKTLSITSKYRDDFLNRHLDIAYEIS